MQGRRLRFGMLTFLTNIRSTNVLHHASCIMHHASSIMHHASCITGRRLRFGMQTVLTNIRSTKVLHHASCVMPCSRYEADIWYVDCSHKYKINQGVMVVGRRPSVEDNFWRKTTFDGRWPLVEDDHSWKTNFDGRRPLIEDELWLKIRSFRDLET